MTDNGLKQLQELLKPIQESLIEVNKRLDKHSKILEQHTDNFGAINKKLEQHTDNFGAINKKLEQHTEALVNIEDTIKVYGDMYEINNGNVRKLEKRIDTLEDKEGIIAPPELRLADL